MRTSTFWTIQFVGNDTTPFELELTWNAECAEPCDNGGEDTHLAFGVADFDAAHALHESIGCIVYENARQGHLLHNRPRRLLAGDTPPTHFSA